MNVDVGETDSQIHRKSVALSAFRRNDDVRAAELRSELPLLLGRLVAEVPYSTIELHVATDADGVVSGLITVEAGSTTRELLADVCELLDPVAELALLETTALDIAETVWPIIGSTRPLLGFSASDLEVKPSVDWSLVGARSVPELVELVCPHAETGIRIQLQARDPSRHAEPEWDVRFAITVRSTSPSLRLRAAIRALFPGLEIAAEPGGQPAVLRVSADELPIAFPVPVAGEQPIVGAYVGTAAPIPIVPTRESVPEKPVRIGSAVTPAGRHVPINLSLQERLRHTHVLGRTGTGKSSFLAGFAHEVAASGDGLLVLDPHGPLVDRIVAELPAEAAQRTWLIRCGDVDNPVPINPMAVEDQHRREIAIDDINSMFQYLFDKKQEGIVGPRFRERVAMGLRALAAVHGRQASLLDVPAALADARFMRRAIVKSGDERLRAWFANDGISSAKSNEYAELVSWVNSKFEAFASTAAMRSILGSGEDAVDMAEAMDNGKIVLVDLSKSDLGEASTRLLGYLYLNETWAGALQRRQPGRPFTVIIDEAQALVAGSLSTMLSEGRKFGLSVVLAHQYLDQLDSDLRPAIDGNVATTVAFRASASDAPALLQRFGYQVSAPTLMTLPDLSAITLRTAAHVTGEPYTLIVDHNERVSAREGQNLADFDATLTSATHYELVDPYRAATSAAARGKSNLDQSDDEQAESPDSRKPNFLDEWLAAREKQKEAPTEYE